MDIEIFYLWQRIRLKYFQHICNIKKYLWQRIRVKYFYHICNIKKYLKVKYVDHITFMLGYSTFNYKFHQILQRKFRKPITQERVALIINVSPATSREKIMDAVNTQDKFNNLKHCESIQKIKNIVSLHMFSTYTLLNHQ